MTNPSFELESLGSVVFDDSDDDEQAELADARFAEHRTLISPEEEERRERIDEAEAKGDDYAFFSSPGADDDPRSDPWFYPEGNADDGRETRLVVDGEWKAELTRQRKELQAPHQRMRELKAAVRLAQNDPAKHAESLRA